ncbi:AAA family ATPase [Arthrobacter sp. B3I9]|uniref:AAA family ATPase n=1 Tax=Arthrobacter sp. B3I9 TaxID=3042270 RepID=UPI0027D830C5|nr:AAA family ATPase [Arthrobacter sp. B3I9]
MGTGDSSLVSERQTIDTTKNPEVGLQFESGHPVKYSNGSWSERRSEIQLFDTTFIEQNVYSGAEITAEHRKNLLDFAIGDNAVQSRKKEEVAVACQQSATASIKSLTLQLTPYLKGMHLPVFRSLKAPLDAALQRKDLEGRRANAMRAGAITSQTLPDNLSIPALNIDEIFEVLNLTLDDIHAEAEELVSAHIHTLRGENVSEWLSHGKELDDQTHCPYCGQSTKDVPLIKMYQTHFNASYLVLKERVAHASHDIATGTSVAIVEQLVEQRNRANERLVAWKPYVDIEELASEPDELAVATLLNLQDLLVGLISKKSLAPTDLLGDEGERAEAVRLWEQFTAIYSDQNELIQSCLQQIEGYKGDLENEDISQLDAELARLDLAETRFSKPVVDLFNELRDAEASLKEAEAAKRAAREDLTAVMTQTLTQYRIDINKHLANLGAAFAIDEIKTNFLGGAPRTDYGITLRGKSVKLAGGKPTFATALSEGDKRTLAFAFFMASMLAAPDLQNRVVVIDDPVSSLDRSRRAYTTGLLVELSAKCAQLILLAHDPSFLRETQSAIRKIKPTPPGMITLQIRRVTSAYSNFSAVDLDRECETPFYTNYRVVDEYVDGKHADVRGAATALRPLLEGHLHRRFPGKLPSDLTLGLVLNEIDSAVSPSPLVCLQPQIKELRELNAFAGKFHHDTNPGFHAELPDPDAVVAFGRRTLTVLHGG